MGYQIELVGELFGRLQVNILIGNLEICKGDRHVSVLVC